MEVARAIREGLLTNVSPTQVRFDLIHRRRFSEAQVPSIRTISDMARELRG